MHYVKNYCENVYKLCESKISGITQKESKEPNSHQLVLYYNYYSYYSQKVLMALHEKELEFEPVVVDITSGEQYSSWFLDNNPRGEVPVLKDSGRVVPDSTRILDHLEKNPHDRHPLVNVSSDVKVVKEIEKFRDLLDAMPAGVITMGSFFHQDLCGQPKLPFILSVRNALKKAECNNASNLRRLAELHPSAKSTLLYKADIHERKHELLADRAQYLAVLDQVEQMLSLVEIQLAAQPSGNWLICDTFTLADISLTVLLERLNVLGLENRFWSAGKKAHVENYYRRVRARPSYRVAVPSLAFHLRIMLVSQPAPTLALVSVGSITTLVGFLYIFKKIVF